MLEDSGATDLVLSLKDLNTYDSASLWPIAEQTKQAIRYILQNARFLL